MHYLTLRISCPEGSDQEAISELARNASEAVSEVISSNSSSFPTSPTFETWQEQLLDQSSGTPITTV